MKLFPTIARAWNAFVEYKKLLPLIVLVDILFVYGLTRLHYEVFNRASTAALKLTSMMSEQVQELSSEAVPELAVLQSAEFIAAYHELVRYISIFFGAALLIWLAGKGITWFLAHKTVEKKTPAVIFATKFLGMTLLWFVIFILLTIGALQVLDYSLFGVFPLVNKATANIFIVFVYWLLAYFVFISYALLPRKVLKQTFVLGVKFWKELLPVHAVTSLIFFVATTVPAHLVKINIYVSFAFIILLALPGIALSRVLWAVAVQKVMRHA